MLNKSLTKHLFTPLCTFGFLITLMFGHYNAFAEFKVPTLTAPVMDQAGVLSSSTVTQLNALLKNVQDSGGSQIQVLIVKNLDGVPIEEATFQVAKSWGLGDAQKDDGALLFISIEDRWMRIEVGQGLEGSLTDAHSRRIIDNAITPSFKAGNFDQGVARGVSEILQHTDPGFNTEELSPPRNEFKPSTQRTIKIIFIILWILFVIFANYNRRGLSGGYRGGGGFGGGFGGGGWSGGGGGFSGGGSSGRW